MRWPGIFADVMKLSQTLGKKKYCRYMPKEKRVPTSYDINTIVQSVLTALPESTTDVEKNTIESMLRSFLPTAVHNARVGTATPHDRTVDARIFRKFTNAIEQQCGRKDLPDAQLRAFRLLRQGLGAIAVDVAQGTLTPPPPPHMIGLDSSPERKAAIGARARAPIPPGQHGPQGDAAAGKPSGPDTSGAGADAQKTSGYQRSNRRSRPQDDKQKKPKKPVNFKNDYELGKHLKTSPQTGPLPRLLKRCRAAAEKAKLPNSHLATFMLDGVTLTMGYYAVRGNEQWTLANASLPAFISLYEKEPRGKGFSDKQPSTDTGHEPTDAGAAATANRETGTEKPADPSPHADNAETHQAATESVASTTAHDDAASTPTSHEPDTTDGTTQPASHSASAVTGSEPSPRQEDASSPAESTNEDTPAKTDAAVQDDALPAPTSHTRLIKDGLPQSVYNAWGTLQELCKAEGLDAMEALGIPSLQRLFHQSPERAKEQLDQAYDKALDLGWPSAKTAPLLTHLEEQQREHAAKGKSHHVA